MNTLPTEYEGIDYQTFIGIMEKMRLAKGWAQRNWESIPTIREDDLLHYTQSMARHGIDPARIETWLAYIEKGTRGKKIPFDPNDINLRAYIIARQYDPDKYTFNKILPELIKYKDHLHPYILRYVIERMREAQNKELEAINKHQRLANCYGRVADQFETMNEPKEVPTEAA
jgi:hypothetical protein